MYAIAGGKLARHSKPEFEPHWTGFKQALHDILDWCTQHRVSAALIGGLAVSAYSRPRATKDIDVTVVTAQSPAALVATLAEHRFVPAFAESIDLAEVSGVLPLRHQPTGAILDLIFARFPFQQDMVKRAVVIDVVGLQVPVVLVHDLCFLKLIAARPQDLADIHALLKANPDINRRGLLEQVQAYAEMIEQPDLAQSARESLKIPNDGEKG